MISVIIPAYNAEKHIDKCLESVLTKQDADYEVIVVNEGSTDKTEKSYRNLPVYMLEDSLPRVDVVIVTVVHLYPWIESDINRVLDVGIESLEDVVIKSIRSVYE